MNFCRDEFLDSIGSETRFTTGRNRSIMRYALRVKGRFCFAYRVRRNRSKMRTGLLAGWQLSSVGKTNLIRKWEPLVEWKDTRRRKGRENRIRVKTRRSLRVKRRGKTNRLEECGVRKSIEIPFMSHSLSFSEVIHWHSVLYRAY